MSIQDIRGSHSLLIRCVFRCCAVGSVDVLHTVSVRISPDVWDACWQRSFLFVWPLGPFASPVAIANAGLRAISFRLEARTARAFNAQVARAFDYWLAALRCVSRRASQRSSFWVHCTNKQSKQTTCAWRELRRRVPESDAGAGGQVTASSLPAAVGGETPFIRPTAAALHKSLCHLARNDCRERERATTVFVRDDWSPSP